MTSEGPQPRSPEGSLSIAQLAQGGVLALEAILDYVHPLLVEAFRVAAIPFWCDKALFTAIRQIDDGRDQDLIERISCYSFVTSLSDPGEGDPVFAVRATERAALHRRWIQSEPEAYGRAHARALEAWVRRPDPNPFAQVQHLVFHQLIADYEPGVARLISNFRAYRNERQWDAADRLLDAAGEAREYLSLLESDRVPELDSLLSYLRARLAQLKARTDEERNSARQRLEELWPDLDPRLRPYLRRAAGLAQAAGGDYVEAMGTFRAAIGALDRQLASEESPFFMTPHEIHTERGHTLIALGDAHVDLARSVGGHHEVTQPGSGPGYWLRAVLHFLVSLPLAVYLSLYLGRRVWNPEFWPVLFELDWIIARLFAAGVRYYHKAEAEWRDHADRPHVLVVEEKLASLYLSMGDVRAAKRRYQSLVEEQKSPLGPYGRATACLGLAESLLRLGRHEEALDPLREALPVLSRYDDLTLDARAHELVGEALLAEAMTEDALRHLSVASDGYQQEKRWVDATRISERLEAHLGAGLLAGVEERARRIIDGVRVRSYPGRYRHPWLLLSYRVVLVLLPVVLFLAPVVAIRLETSVGLGHSMSHRPKPVWTSGGTVAVESVELNLDLARVDVYRVPDSQTVLWSAVAVVLAYLVLSFALGLAAVALTPLRTVQESGRGTSVCLNDERFFVGQGSPTDDESCRVPEGAAGTSLPWAGITTFVKANVSLWRQPLRDGSSFGLAAGQDPEVIGGSTVWYAPLQKRVSSFVPAGSRVVDLDYSLLRSPLGALYLLSLLWVFAVGLGAALAWGKVTPPVLLVDLYPYSLSFLALAPLWWFVVKPLQRGLHLRPRSRLPLGILGIGMALFLVQVLARFQPLLTAPNLFLPLITIVLLASSEIALWRASAGGERVFSLALRVASAALVLCACLLMVMVLVRDTRAYALLVRGNLLSARALKDDALLAGQTDSPGREGLQEAIDAYHEASTLANQPILGLGASEPVRQRLSVVPPEHMTQISALTSQAIVQAYLGDYGGAADTFSDALKKTDRPSQILGWLAVAKLGAATRTTPDGEVEFDRERYRFAIALLASAQERDPGEGIYYLWSAVAHHALDELIEAQGDYLRALALMERNPRAAPRQKLQALIGLGWVAYERDHKALSLEFMDQSLDYFEQAIALEIVPKSAEALLGKGYALYALEEYPECLSAWEEARKLELRDPAILKALGAVHWKLGGLSTHSDERCDEYTKSTEYFAASADRQNLSPQSDQDIAFTYRTLGYMDYLIGWNCPEPSKIAMYEAAIDSFSRALELDDRAEYWYRRGRLSYGMWIVLKGEGPGPPETGRCLKAQCLADAISDLEVAKAMDPSGQSVNDDPPDVVIAEVRRSATARANYLFSGDDYEQALDYYELVADSAPNDSVAAFRAGLASMHLHKDREALAWYEKALARARAANNLQSAQKALAELHQAQIVDPVLPAGDILALFEAAGIHLQADSAEIAFVLALTAVIQATHEEAAERYSRGIELAVPTKDLVVVQSAASALRDFLLSHPERSLSEAYWPLHDDPVTRELSLPDLDRPDLYWRYRAEFGFQLLADGQLLRARPGQASEFEEVFRSIAADIERAYALNDGLQNRRDFFVDANVGWIYFRLGDKLCAEELYEQALDAYEQAAGHIQPGSKNAALDLTEDLFKAGLTALRLGQVERATGWYEQGIELVQRLDREFGLQEKVGPAIEDLQALVEEKPELETEAQAILDRLQDLLPSLYEGQAHATKRP